MLVLTRKSGEKIAIGEGIVITVLQREGKHIRLGIEAPREFSIRREELPPRNEVSQQAKLRCPLCQHD